MFVKKIIVLFVICLISISAIADNIILSLDNDVFGTKDTDQYYTHGTHISVSKDIDSSWIWIDNILGKVNRKSYSIGQYLYTPTNIATSVLLEEDRRYAGYLYYGYTLYSENIKRCNSLQGDIGVIGPSSCAEKTQIEFHKLVDSQEPLGWDNQIDDRLTLNITYQTRYRLYRYKNYLDTISLTGVSAGNVVTMANIGGLIRAGFNIPEGFGTTRLEPVPRKIEKVSIYGIVSGEGRVIGYNAFLEDVNHKPFVGDFSYGVGISLYQTSLTFLQTFRTKEFDGQVDNSSFGSFVFSYSW